MKNILTITSLVLTSLSLYAQQDPLYSQYLNNPVLLNPAYTGINNKLNIVSGYRKQWAGFDGSPTTLNFSAHTSLYDNKVGAGILVVQDKIGETEITQYNATYSYKIALKGDRTISFGLQTGFVNYRNDDVQLNPQQAGDPAFAFINDMKFNVGAGIMLKSERYLIGLSAPRLTKASVDMGGQPIEIYNQHFYLMGAYMVYLTDRIRLKPSALLRATQGAFSYDLNFNLNLEENYTVGLLTRNLNTFGLLVQMNINDYRIGYVFEVPTGASVGARYTSHEISLALSLAAFGFHERAKSNF
jgi:type IX secretion system PorP/SprF family membrane protein